MSNAINTMKSTGAQLVAAKMLSRPGLDSVLDGITESEVLDVSYQLMANYLSAGQRDEIETEIWNPQDRMRAAIIEIDNGMAEGEVTEDMQTLMDNFSNALFAVYEAQTEQL